MDLTNIHIQTRLKVLNSTEKKSDIEDVIFTISLKNDEEPAINIYLIPYEGLAQFTDKAKLRDFVVDSLLDKMFFKNNDIDVSLIDQVLFFSFDIICSVDYCFFLDYNKNIKHTIVYDLNGKTLLTKNHSIEDAKSINAATSNKIFKEPFYLFFDTETTGLPLNWKAPVSDLKNWPRLVQLAWLQYDKDGNKIGGNNFIIKPDGFTIPSDASKIHGISNDLAMHEGIALQSVLNDFQNLISQSSYLVAHNMSFDEKIVGAEFLRKNMANSIATKNRICTMEKSTKYCKLDGPYGYKWPKLSELHYKLFGTGFDEAHNAAVDINATAKCFWELKKRGII